MYEDCVINPIYFEYTLYRAEILTNNPNTRALHLFFKFNLYNYLNLLFCECYILLHRTTCCVTLHCISLGYVTLHYFILHYGPIDLFTIFSPKHSKTFVLYSNPSLQSHE